MKWETATDQDREIIARQIERAPRNLSGIARRCRHHCPQVVVNSPLPQDAEDAEFFPTVFWLTCPAAVRHISRIEDQGYIRKIQETVSRDRDCQQNLREAHQEYIYLRLELLRPEERMALRRTRKPLAEALERLGIGGVADLKTIKCLHTHYAHYLATQRNPIGRLVKTMLDFAGRGQACNACRGLEKTPARES